MVACQWQHNMSEDRDQGIAFLPHAGAQYAIATVISLIVCSFLLPKARNRRLDLWSCGVRPAPSPPAPASLPQLA